MDKRVIDLHDEALLLRPDGASHDSELCPVCADWAMTEDGVPACHDRLEGDAHTSPYGDIEYADQGHRGGVKRYPIDTEAHARWSNDYITRPEQAKNYSEEQLDEIRSRIEEALEGFGADEGNDNQQTAPEGVMDTINRETHEALVAKAVEDATASLEAEKSSLEAQVASLTEERDTALERAETAESEVERIETELDTAQVKLKTSEDEVASLKTEIERRDEEAEKNEVASKRADQVRNLGLFPEEYIQEKAGRWAEYPEEDFADLVDSWRKAQETTSGEHEEPGGSVETASKLTGSSEGENTEQVSARKRVLGIA